MGLANPFFDDTFYEVVTCNPKTYDMYVTYPNEWIEVTRYENDHIVEAENFFPNLMVRPLQTKVCVRAHTILNKVKYLRRRTLLLHVSPLMKSPEWFNWKKIESGTKILSDSHLMTS